jgi:hypothetical protein
MHIYISPPSEIITKQGPKGRFSVTVIDDDGKPFLTTDGWTVDVNEDVRAPTAKTAWGRPMGWTYLTKEFRSKIKEIVTAYPIYAVMQKRWKGL